MNNLISKSLIAFLLFAFCLTSYADNKESPRPFIAGLWLTDDAETIVKISRCKQSLCGRIAGFIKTNEDYGKTTPVEEKKFLGEIKAICSTDLLGGFKKQGKQWKKGWIIDFESENKYSANLQLAKNNVLKVRVYEVREIFGETFFWKRINKIPVDCDSIIKREK